MMVHGQNGAHSSEFRLRNKLEGYSKLQTIKNKEIYQNNSI
jgi:hypothetical protein